MLFAKINTHSPSFAFFYKPTHTRACACVFCLTDRMMTTTMTTTTKVTEHTDWPPLCSLILSSTKQMQITDAQLLLAACRTACQAAEFALSEAYAATTCATNHCRGCEHGSANEVDTVGDDGGEDDGTRASRLPLPDAQVWRRTSGDVALASAVTAAAASDRATPPHKRACRQSEFDELLYDRLYVCGVPENATFTDIRLHFSQCGLPVTRVAWGGRKRDGRRFVFVGYANPSAAAHARDMFQGSNWRNNVLHINYACRKARST